MFRSLKSPPPLPRGHDTEVCPLPQELSMEARGRGEVPRAREGHLVHAAREAAGLAPASPALLTREAGCCLTRWGWGHRSTPRPPQSTKRPQHPPLQTKSNSQVSVTRCFCGLNSASSCNQVTQAPDVTLEPSGIQWRGTGAAPETSRASSGHVPLGEQHRVVWGAPGFGVEVCFGLQGHCPLSEGTRFKVS